MGAGMKKAAAAAKATRRPQWEIRWRGLITRDVGVVYFYTDTESDARESFLETYPAREITSIKIV